MQSGKKGPREGKTIPPPCRVANTRAKQPRTADVAAAAKRQLAREAEGNLRFFASLRDSKAAELALAAQAVILHH